LSFSPVAIRGAEVFRTRPEEGFGLCRHSTATNRTERMAAPAAIAPPILVRDHAIYGDLQGRLHVVPLDVGAPAWSFKTPFGKAISAPACVADGRIFFGCEDGYLYASLRAVALAAGEGSRT